MIQKSQLARWPLAALLGLLGCGVAQADVTVTSLYAFTGTAWQQNPTAGAVLGSDGRLHGIAGPTPPSFSDPRPTMTWSLKTDGSDLQTTTVTLPAGFSADLIRSPLLVDNDGRFYGAFYQVPGTVFTFSPSEPFSTIAAASNGGFRYPNGNPAIDSGGNLYLLDRGNASANAGAIRKLSADHSRFSTVKTFDTAPDGSRVNVAAVIVGTDAWLYGVNSGGGANGIGTIYRIRPDGSELTILHDFASADGRAAAYLTNSAEGLRNSGSLVEVKEWLYGNTYQLGTNGDGTLYRIRKDGTGFEVLHQFNNTARQDGRKSAGMLILASDGNVYGSTNAGGAHDDGTLFRLVTANVGNADRGFEKLHDFESAVDGKLPLNLSLGSDGLLYGITVNGGSAGNFGTVFKV
ncbi:MAG: choice-of-anchor tandem repeat GloVer-containing protein, partial [Solimonas sp.]